MPLDGIRRPNGVFQPVGFAGRNKWQSDKNIDALVCVLWEAGKDFHFQKLAPHRRLIGMNGRLLELLSSGEISSKGRNRF